MDSMEIDNELLFQIIAVLLHKMGNPEITLTNEDLDEALKVHGADRLILCGRGNEMRVGIYSKENEPIQADAMHPFH